MEAYEGYSGTIIYNLAGREGEHGCNQNYTDAS